MIDGLFQSTTLPALEEVAKFSQRRHEVLAGNVANLDTPGYRARDLSVSEFERSLAASIERQVHGPAASESVSPGATGPDAEPHRAMEHLVYHDGSDINLERQVTEISKNQSMHNLAIALMRSQFSTLKAAITERA
jgi:flagellar basal-body rod protein FlgB